MKNSWKISPGDHAENWQLFSSAGCIGIGWLPEQDYSVFKSQEDILSALEAEHGVGASGHGAGAARIVWAFANEIAVGDIVIANDGRNRVVGVGTVSSEYITSDSEMNPIRGADTHRRHARLVDWVVSKPVELVPERPRQFFFGIPTLHSLKQSDLKAILASYQAVYQNDPELAESLAAILNLPLEGAPPNAVDLHRPPTRIETTTFRILRDTRVAISVKELHNYECQLCGLTINLPNGKRYAEAHHIRPLGGGHEGDDQPSNVLCLCPNHHAHCDYGVVKLDPSEMNSVAGHSVAPENIDYHNDNIFGKGQ